MIWAVIEIIVVGFVAGLIARTLLPGPQNPQGFLQTTALGIRNAPEWNRALPPRFPGKQSAPRSEPRPSSAVRPAWLVRTRGTQPSSSGARSGSVGWQMCAGALRLRRSAPFSRVI